MISEIDIRDMNDYQAKAWGTALESARNAAYLFNGLAGETGEVCSLFAKAVRDGVPDNEKFQENLKKELGDVLWVTSSLAKLYGYTLQEVAQANIEKLYSRMKRNTIGGNGNDR